MLKIKGMDIHLTKGDTGYITLDIRNSQNKPYKYNDGDTLTMTIKKTLTNSKVIEKTVNADESFVILPDDTKELSVGRYKYDVQVNTAIGEVFTVIPESAFYLEKEVTE